jgi:hypothetical protein
MDYLESFKNNQFYHEATVKESDDQWADYLGLGVLVKHPMSLVTSFSVLFYVAGAAMLGVLFQETYNDETSYDKYALTAKVFGFVNFGILLLLAVIGRCSMPHGTALSPIFKRATLDLVYSSPGTGNHGLAFGINTESMLAHYTSNIRHYGLMAHLMLTVLFLLFWFEVEDPDADTTLQGANRLLNNISSVRHFLFLWMVVVPSLTTGFIDFVHIAQKNGAADDRSISERIAGRHGRAWWTLLSISQRMLLYGVIIFLLDPHSELIFFHETNSDWEKVILISVVVVTLLLNVCFWIKYHTTHVNRHDKPFAYMDFPINLVFVIAFSWAFWARIQNVHTHFPASYDFLIQSLFLWGGTLGIINIPPAVDFVNVHINQDYHVTNLEIVIPETKDQRSTEADVQLVPLKDDNVFKVSAPPRNSNRRSYD